MRITFFIISLGLYINCFFISGCTYHDDIKIDDPQILKEMKWMRDKGIWTEKDYKKHLREGDAPAHYGDDEVYLPSCESTSMLACDTVAPRSYIQKMMKEDEQKINFL